MPSASRPHPPVVFCGGGVGARGLASSHAALMSEATPEWKHRFPRHTAHLTVPGRPCTALPPTGHWLACGQVWGFHCGVERVLRKLWVLEHWESGSSDWGARPLG